jgi:hypothetical protein
MDVTGHNMVSKKVSDIPVDNFRLNIELFRKNFYIWRTSSVSTVNTLLSSNILDVDHQTFYILHTSYIALQSYVR